jgi:hypothetical protein
MNLPEEVQNDVMRNDAKIILYVIKGLPLFILGLCIGYFWR